MGKIKKILENELVGGTQTTDVYPITSTKAVYDENNERLDNILGGLLDKISVLKNAGYLYAGVATPTTDPGTPKAKVFYVANGKGTYDNFGGIKVMEDEVVFLYWDSSWHKALTGIASQEKLTELKEKVDALTFSAFYGYFPDSSSLPVDVTTPGYAYVGLDNPYKIWNFNGESWSDSGTSIDMNDADEEDITRNADGKLQFKDRTYGDGMGYVILRKNKSFAEQVTEANTIYEIRHEFNLKGANVTIPEGCVLKFDGGKIFNGEVVFDNTKLQGTIRCYTDISGTLDESEINVGWFTDGINVASQDTSRTIQQCVDIAYNSTFVPTVFLPIGRYFCYNKITLPTGKRLSLKGENLNTNLIAANGGTMKYLLGREGDDSRSASIKLDLSDITIDANYRCEHAVYMPCMSESHWESVACISGIVSNLYTNYSFIDYFENCTFLSGDAFNHPTKYDVYLGPQQCNAIKFSACRFEGAYIALYTDNGYNITIDGCTIEGIRTTGVYACRTEGLTLTNTYFEDVSWYRNTTDPSQPTYIPVEELGMQFVDVHEYNFSGGWDCSIKTITPFVVHADIIKNAERLTFKSNFRNMSLGNRYHPSVTLEERYDSSRSSVIMNNTSQHVSTDGVENDCFIFVCGTLTLFKVQNNSISSISTKTGDWDFDPTYDVKVLMYPIYNKTIGCVGLCVEDNVVNNKYTNNVSPVVCDSSTSASTKGNCPIYINRNHKPVLFSYSEIGTNMTRTVIHERIYYTFNKGGNSYIKLESNILNRDYLSCFRMYVKTGNAQEAIIIMSAKEEYLTIPANFNGYVYFAIFRNVKESVSVFSLVAPNVQDSLIVSTPEIYVDNYDIKIAKRGVLSERPSNIPIGFVFMLAYESEKFKPIWWTGTKWVDATGADV